MIYAQDLILIDINNYKFITRLDCSICDKITDQLISNPINLIELKCIGCNDHVSI